MKKVNLFLVFISFCGLLLAKDFWKKKPYTEWGRKDVQKMLLDSPWAQDQTFGRAQAGANDILSNPRSGQAQPGGGVPASVSQQGMSTMRRGDHTVSRQYYVRFFSATPVRMAYARNALLGKRVTAEAAEKYIKTKPFNGKIVLELGVAPGQDATEFDRVTTELLKKKTYLLLKGSKRKIYLERYISPSEAKRTQAYMVFPRQENGRDLISLEEGEVRFICELSPETKLNRKFKLKKMIFNGKLEM